VDCITAEAVDVEAGRRRVIARRPGGDTIEVPYDRLIVAVGVRQSYFGHDETADDPR
jgi:NADH:ubiquinone reductase (H+-translocating)